MARSVIRPVHPDLVNPTLHSLLYASPGYGDTEFRYVLALELGVLLMLAQMLTNFQATIHN